jgi:hypothetical protein
MPAASLDLPMWPVGAECIDCNGSAPRLLLSFVKWRTCDPHPSGSQSAINCTALCSAQGNSDGATCHSGVELVSSVIARLKGLTLDPGGWTADGAALEIGQGPDPILWGAAFTTTPNGTLIFGRRVSANQLMVARVTGDLLQGAAWQFWHGPSAQWNTNFSGQVAVASQIGALVSVDAITRAGTTRFLLTHGDVGHLLFARVSTDAASGSAPPLWPLPTASTPRIDVVSIEASLRAQQADLIGRGKCQPGSGFATPDWSHCGTSYHGLAHAHLALSDASGPLLVPTSYVIPYGPNPLFNPALPEDDSNARTGVVNATYYRPKFTVIQLDKLRPWCSVDCWEGIVHDYAQRSVGAQPVVFAYDVQQSPRFYATLTRTSGAASARVEFWNGSTRLSSLVCPQDPLGPSVFTCNVPRPTAARLAQVVVRGAASDQFTLRTHYAGSF